MDPNEEKSVPEPEPVQDNRAPQDDQGLEHEADV